MDYLALFITVFIATIAADLIEEAVRHLARKGR